MNRQGEQGGPGVSLGRWANRKGADLSREHQDQQGRGKQNRPGHQTETPGSPEGGVILGYRYADRILQKREAGSGKGMPGHGQKEGW